MRISAMNRVNFNSTPKVNQNFKGLWGKSRSEHYEDRMYSDDSTYHYYYPFKDESKRSIDKAVDEHTYSRSSCSDPHVVYDPISFSSSASVTVCKKLPFTEQEFNAYMNNPNSTAKRHIIEAEIIKNDLEKNIHY